MRLNKFIAHATGVSRRSADELISQSRVSLNGNVTAVGQDIDPSHDIVLVDGKQISLPKQLTLIMLNKPVGYVCSRSAQAKNVRTIYDLLPDKYRMLKSIGRLDKDSSGLILLTDDGDLAQQLTHPRYSKTKQYVVKINKPLAPLHQQMISDFGINLDDGRSQLLLEALDQSQTRYQVTMHEGRNRQIRRTFAALGYNVIGLHRFALDNYQLDDLPPGQWRQIR